MLAAPAGAVRTLIDAEPAIVTAALDLAAGDPDLPRPLLLELPHAKTAEAIVEGVAAALGDAALALWPVWWSDVRLPERDDALGRAAARLAAGEAGRSIPGVSASWGQAAVELALAGGRPRVPGAALAVEIEQLSRVIGRSGLALVLQSDAVLAAPASGVLALEYLARHVGGPVIALFAQFLPDLAPFDRILYGARRLESPAPAATLAPVRAPAWIAPLRGQPHPMSAVEQALAVALRRDAELGGLFAFNLGIATVRGTSPRVDMVWLEGRLAVEIDGDEHRERYRFAQDRQRDYELVISGFTVLRLTNDEIAQDLELALEKIRNVVNACRGRLRGETWR